MKSIASSGTALSSKICRKSLPTSTTEVFFTNKQAKMRDNGRRFAVGAELCDGVVMAKNFVGGVMIIYKLARTAADPLPPYI